MQVIKQEAYGRKADIWSLGMTVLEMATAKHPWQNFSNKFAAMTEIASGPKPLRLLLPPPSTCGRTCAAGGARGRGGGGARTAARDAHRCVALVLSICVCLFLVGCNCLSSVPLLVLGASG